MPNANIVTVGYANGQPIAADIGPRVDQGGIVEVTLTADYTLAEYGIIRPCFVGAEHFHYPGRVITSGTAVALLKPEADALVAAGAATLAEES